MAGIINTKKSIIEEYRKYLREKSAASMKRNQSISINNNRSGWKSKEINEIMKPLQILQTRKSSHTWREITRRHQRRNVYINQSAHHFERRNRHQRNGDEKIEIFHGVKKYRPFTSSNQKNMAISRRESRREGKRRRKREIIENNRKKK